MRPAPALQLLTGDRACVTPTITVTNPDWLAELAPPDLVIPDPAARVRLAVRLALENVERGTGGPFGAAVFEAATGRLVAAGGQPAGPARPPPPPPAGA